VAILCTVPAGGLHDRHQLAGQRHEQLRLLLVDLPHQVHHGYCPPHSGNYSANRVTPVDGYIVTVVPFASFLAMFVFYLIWKGHYAKISSQAEQDKDDIKPEKFCIEIDGLEGTDVTEEELGKFFSAFGPVY
jgi:hypothetical protein